MWTAGELEMFVRKAGGAAAAAHHPVSQRIGPHDGRGDGPGRRAFRSAETGRERCGRDEPDRCDVGEPRRMGRLRCRVLRGHTARRALPGVRAFIVRARSSAQREEQWVGFRNVATERARRVPVAAAIVLLVGTGVVYQQLGFMRSMDLGIDLEQILTVPSPRVLPEGIDRAEAVETFTQELRRLPAVQGTATSSAVPGQGFAFTTQGIRKVAAELVLCQCSDRAV